MKVKVHWILDGVAELEADTPEDAEREVERMLTVYLEEENDLTSKLGAKAIQGKAFLPGVDEDDIEDVDLSDDKN